MKCSGCGAELAPEDRFCGECGAPRREVPAPVVQAERPEAQPPPPAFTAAKPQAPPPRKRSRGKWAAVGCLGLLAVACVVAGLSGAALLTLLSRSQELTTAPPGLPGAEATATPRPTPTWLPAPPPTPTRPPGPPTIGPAPTMEPAVVLPYCSALDQSPLYVRENQPVLIYWGWLATTPDYVQDFLDTAKIEILLDGEEVRPDTQSEIEYDSDDEGYVVHWSADVGTLTPGSHRVDYHVSWSRQISDGWYTYGPGGDYEEEREYCELIVE